MSGNLNFITSNPVSGGFDRMQRTLDQQEQRDEERRRREEERGVDRALRSGLGQISASGYQAPPSQQPQAQPAATGQAPPMRLDDRSAFRSAIGSVEDPSGQAINPYGFTGRYQFGVPALHAAGMYQPAPGERLQSNEWRGQITLPDGRRLTRDQFRQDQGAQETAFDRHQENLDREIAARGLDRYIGTRVMDQPIDRAALYSLMHHGGPEGTARFLRSGGIYDPADQNGMRMSTYAQAVQKRINERRPAQAAPQPAGGGGFGQSPYAPMISQLAQTPGGGRAGLQLVTADMANQRAEQTRTDRLAQQGAVNQRFDRTRQDQFEQRALEAFARGDREIGNHYLRQSGGTLPPEITDNPNMMMRFGQGASMARTIYGEDRQGAARFVRNFMETGNPAAALTAAGDPTGGAPGRVQWTDDGTGRAVGTLVDPRTGQSRPILDHEGQPIVRAPGQGQQQRVADRDVRLRMLRAAGYDEQEANAIAAGAMPSANSIVSAYSRVLRIVSEDFSVPPAQRQGRVEQMMGDMFGPGWQDRMRGRVPGGGGGPVAAPPVPAPTAAPTGGLPRIGAGDPRKADAEYDALPSGTEFIGPDGKKRRKP